MTVAGFLAEQRRKAHDRKTHRAWCKRNAQRRRAQILLWRKRNKRKCYLIHRKWRLAHMAVRRVAKRLWARTHTDSVKRTHLKWRTDHRACYLASNRKSWRKHRKKRLAQKRAYHKATYPMRRKRLIEQTAAYAKAHPEIRRKVARNYRKRHPDKFHAVAARRSAIKRAGCAKDPKVDALIALWRRRKDFVCFYCKGKFAASKLTVDHFVPLIKGGLHISTNLRKSCRSCNSRKSDKLPMEFQPAGS